MRNQRRMAGPSPAPVRTTIDLPTSGYFLMVDGLVKTEFKTKDLAIKAAKDLKGRFPMLQIKLYDAQEKRTEAIELASA
jgi:hypothetical protein